MKNLKSKIKAYLENDLPIIDDLDDRELNYINNLLNELNSTGRIHTISEVEKKGNKLIVKTEFVSTYFEK